MIMGINISIMFRIIFCLLYLEYNFIVCHNTLADSLLPLSGILGNIHQVICEGDYGTASEYNVTVLSDIHVLLLVHVPYGIYIDPNTVQGIPDEDTEFFLRWFPRS